MDKHKMDKCLTEMRENCSEQAFEELYNESKKGLFSFIFSFVKNVHDAEDIMQQTYINARYAANYTSGTNALAWLLEIAKNNCLNFIKKRGREVLFSEIDEERASYEVPFEQNSVLELINKNLSESEAEIVILHLVTGLKHREIAELLNLPLGTVLWKYNVAIKTLKQKLKEVSYE